MADFKDGELALGVGSGTPAFTTFTLNQTTDALETIFRAPEPDTITTVLLRQGTVTGTAPTYRVSLQGVDGSGNPDGTIKGSGTCYVDVTPTAGNNSTMLRLTLGASYTWTRGEMVAIVAAYQSGTVDGSNNCSFTSTNNISHLPGCPYAIHNDAGSRTRQTSASANIALASATKVYGMSAETINTAAFSSTSSPDERGIKFTLPAGCGDTFQVAGVRWTGAMAAAGAHDLVLYDGTTVLQSISIDNDHDAAATSARMRMFFFDESTLSTLTFGTEYRLVLKPTTGSLTLYDFTVDASGDLEGWPFGSMVCFTGRTDAGSWTDDATKRPTISGIILADVTEPSGSSGGLLTHGGMTGGLNG